MKMNSIIPTDCITNNFKGSKNDDTSEDNLHLWLSESENEVNNKTLTFLTLKVKIMQQVDNR